MATGTINSKNVFFIYPYDQTYGTIDGLVDVLLAAMTTKGIYVCSGSWKNHGYGYQAICVYDPTGNNKKSGTVYEYANGYVWTFFLTEAGTVRIKQLA